ncbi:MAG: hypothetical protein ACXWR4_05645 [Bdellovibrionota bacterium]
MRALPLFFLSAILFSAPALARMDQGPAGPTTPLSPPQILSGIYQPWTGPLAEMGKALKPDRNYLVWVHVPAQHPMDLRSSETFRRWVIATPLLEFTISHNMVAFRCKNPGGQFVTGATGMTGANNLQDAKALLAGYGLSVFFATYLDGHLNPESEVASYVTTNLAKRGVVFGAFEVTDEQCGAMQGFLSDFVNHPNRPFERFTSLGDHEKFEGGGCVTFASALMNKAGVLDSVIPSFFREMYAARYLLGGNLAPQDQVLPPATPWLRGKRRSISINLIWNNPWDAAPEDFPGYANLHQMDPEKMLYALKQFGNVALENESGGARSRDARMLAESPLGARVSLTANNLEDPGGPLDFTYTTIDDNFDGMAETGRLARDWFRGRVRAGFRLRVAQAVGMPVLVMEKP